MKPRSSKAIGLADGRGAAQFPESRHPTKKNICAVVVTYRPEYEGRQKTAANPEAERNGVGRPLDLDFTRCFRTIAAQVDKLLIIDNASRPHEVDILRKLRDELKADLVLNHTNMGIASALNRGVEWAIARGAQWILALDQDSMPEPDMVQTLIGAYEDFPSRNKVAVIGSNYHTLYGDLATVPARRSQMPSWQEMTTVISSGSLISVDVFSRIGPFRDDFFMDCIDLEYCLRARAKGYSVIMTTKSLMVQPIGNPIEHFFFRKRVIAANYSPDRRFWMSRNHAIIAREYLFREPAWVLAVLWSRIKTLAVVCLFEDDRMLKVRAAWQGTLASVLSRAPSRRRSELPCSEESE